MKRLIAAIVNFFKRIFKEIFYFCLVSLLSYLVILLCIVFLTEPPKGVLCGMCLNFRYKEIYMLLGSIWVFLSLFFILLKKWFLGIDFFIVSLAILLGVPYILKIF